MVQANTTGRLNGSLKKKNQHFFFFFPISVTNSQLSNHHSARGRPFPCAPHALSPVQSPLTAAPSPPCCGQPAPSPGPKMAARSYLPAARLGGAVCFLGRVALSFGSSTGKKEDLLPFTPFIPTKIPTKRPCVTQRRKAVLRVRKVRVR